MANKFSNLELVQTNNEVRTKALNKLGFHLDKDGFVLDTEDNTVICKYGGDPVHITKAAILPGSTLIINADHFSMAQYFEEYCEDGS